MGKAGLGYRTQGSKVNFPLACISVADCPTTMFLPSLSWAPNHELNLSVVLHVQTNKLQAHTHSCGGRCRRGLITRGGNTGNYRAKGVSENFTGQMLRTSFTTSLSTREKQTNSQWYNLLQDVYGHTHTPQNVWRRKCHLSQLFQIEKTEIIDWFMIPFKLFYLLSSSFLKQTNKNATEWSLDKWKRDWIPVPSERLPEQPWAHSLTLLISHFSCVEQQLLLHSGVERSKQGVAQGKQYTAATTTILVCSCRTEKMSKAH